MELIASLSWFFIQLIFAEVVLGMFLKVTKSGAIRFTLAGFSPFRKTELYILTILVIGAGWIIFNNTIQNIVIGIIEGFGTAKLFALPLVSGIFLFWTTKVILGRRFGFRLTLLSLFLIAVGFLGLTGIIP